MRRPHLVGVSWSLTQEQVRVTKRLLPLPLPVSRLSVIRHCRHANQEPPNDESDKDCFRFIESRRQSWPTRCHGRFLQLLSRKKRQHLLFAIDPTHPGISSLCLPTNRNSDSGADAIRLKGHGMQSQSLPTPVCPVTGWHPESSAMTAISLQTRTYS